MTAAAFNFPFGFLKSAIFIFKGETANDLLTDFNDVQDLEQHTMNLTQILNYTGNKEGSNFADDLYTKWYRKEQITFDEVKHFFELFPDLCTMLDFVTAENAIEILKEKYPEALCR